MKVHDKKLIQPYFDDVWNGIKTFEIRKNDCDYQIGDLLILREFNEKTNQYEDTYVLTKIIYKIDNFVGIEQGYCVLGIKVLERGVKND